MFGQASVAVAISWDPVHEVEAVAKPKRKQARNYTPHQRLVMKAQALFPGCEIVSHRDGSEPKV